MSRRNSTAKPQSPFGLVKRSARDFMEDDCPSMAAALAYYTIFALPPLLILILTLVSAIWDPQTIQRAMEGQFASMVGSEAAQQIHQILQNADRPGAGGPLATVLSIAALVFGATGAFVQLQNALNRAWEVEPDPEAGGIKNFLSKRVFSFGMILTVGFVLLVSLALSAVLSSFGEALADLVPGLGPAILQGIDLAISLAVITLLFGAIFKILPDAQIAWNDVWVGAAATALLFIIGKFLIGLYIGQSDPGQAFGAAGSLAVLLIWIYYSGLLVLFGAEFTQRWAESRGHGIEPEEGAVRVFAEKRQVREPEPSSDRQ